MTNTPCPDHEKLMLMVFDDLNGDEKSTLEAHIATCLLCRRELAILNSTLASVPDNTRSLTSAEVAIFSDRVIAAATAKNQRVYPWKGATAFGAVVLLAIFIFKPGSAPVSNGFNVPSAHELAVLNEFDLMLDLDLLENLELLEILEDRG